MRAKRKKFLMKKLKEGLILFAEVDDPLSSPGRKLPDREHSFLPSAGSAGTVRAPAKRSLELLPSPIARLSERFRSYASYLFFQLRRLLGCSRLAVARRYLRARYLQRLSSLRAVFAPVSHKNYRNSMIS